MRAHLASLRLRRRLGGHLGKGENLRFDLTDMQLFLHVIEAGSITAGAERAHIALASASARVRGMEETLGMPLLVRGRRGVHPTPVGETLVHHARLVLSKWKGCAANRESTRTV
jgi:DNA-binding transcriptional LysR family regulator